LAKTIWSQRHFDRCRGSSTSDGAPVLQYAPFTNWLDHQFKVLPTAGNGAALETSECEGDPNQDWDILAVVP
jgi:hypothetical protein